MERIESTLWPAARRELERTQDLAALLAGQAEQARALRRTDQAVRQGLRQNEEMLRQMQL